MVSPERRALFNKISDTAQKILKGDAEYSALDKYKLDDVRARANWDRDPSVQNVCRCYLEMKASQPAQVEVPLDREVQPEQKKSETTLWSYVKDIFKQAFIRVITNTLTWIITTAILVIAYFLLK